MSRGEPAVDSAEIWGRARGPRNQITLSTYKVLKGSTLSTNEHLPLKFAATRAFGWQRAMLGVGQKVDIWSAIFGSLQLLWGICFRRVGARGLRVSAVARVQDHV